MKKNFSPTMDVGLRSDVCVARLMKRLSFVRHEPFGKMLQQVPGFVPA